LTSLLAPEFVRELEALRRLLFTRARSGAPGSVAARRRGRGAEFEEHRPYSPGDDVGKLDWLAYARTGHPVAKEHRADEDTVLRLVIDGSASAGFGSPPKLHVATRIAASLAYLSLAAGHRTQVVVASAGKARVSPAHRGRPALGAVLHELSSIEPCGETRLEESVAHLLAVSVRPGALFVLSDFFDDGPVVEALHRARHAGHDVTLVQILAPEELHPVLEGDVALVDAETGEAVDVGAEAVGAYEHRLSSLCDALSAFSRRAGARYIRATTDEPLLAVVRRVLESA
jgi:uncharacterized protein (DUF58 family)